MGDGEGVEELAVSLQSLQIFQHGGGVEQHNLSRELGGAWVTDSRQGASVAADYRVLIDVQRFDSVLGEAVTVEALWVIRASAGGEARRGRSLVREPVNGSGYDALVAAHNRALATVSHEIAEALRGFASR